MSSLARYKGSEFDEACKTNDGVSAGISDKERKYIIYNLFLIQNTMLKTKFHYMYKPKMPAGVR